MTVVRMLLVLVLLLPFETYASGNETMSPVFRVQVQVDGQGRVSVTQPLRSLKEPYAGIVKHTLESWRFHPALVGEKPAVTITWLSVALASTSMPNGDLGVAVTYFGNGPSLGDLALTYPADMVRRRLQARLLVEATVGTDGLLSDIQMVKTTTSDGLDVSSFVKSARDTLGKAHVHPILVDGQPVASHVRFPINYVLGSTEQSSELEKQHGFKRARDSSRFVSGQPAASVPEELPSGAMIALDSPVTKPAG